MWLKAEVRGNCQICGKYQRTRNSNKEMPEANKKGNVMSKKAQEWL